MKHFLLILALVGCFGCGWSQPPVDSSISGAKVQTATPAASAEKERLEANRQLWEQKGANSYTMILELDSTSPIPPPSAVRVEVENDSILSVSPLSKSEESHAVTLYDSFSTVDRMFAFIADMLDDREEKGKLTVVYNAALGYPEKIEYFSIASDGSFSLTVRSLSAR